MGKKSGSNNKLFQSGSKWVRADFHLHTWKDKEFHYAGEKDSFINDYVSKLVEEDIRVGVITNHNKFDRDDFMSLREKARQEDIFLLPGVELSVNDGANGIHTLVIFSDQWITGGNFIDQFLNVTFKGTPPEVFEHENDRSNDSLIETIKKLEDYHMDFMLIFAHVEDKSGLWHELGGGKIEKLGKDEFFRRRTSGFQKVRTNDGEKKCRKKVKYWLKNWYPAEVEGSDCKRIEEIGRGDPCFIKIGGFSFEAVKYALLDHENRLSTKQQPGYGHSYIRSISFEGGVLDGKTIRFSPELNALIGIRGSGKSSILETLRYGLDIPLGMRAMDRDYKESLIAHALGSGGKVKIKAVDRYGQEFEVQRILNELPDVYVDEKLQPGIKIRETIISKPIYFGQKDLSSSGEGFEKSLVEKLVGEKLVGIRQKIIRQQQRVTDVIDRLQKLSDVDVKIKEQEERKQDAEFRLQVFRNLGIEKVLQKQGDFETDSNKIKQIIEKTGDYLSAYEEFISLFEDDMYNLKIYESNQNSPFFTEFFKIYESIVTGVRENKNNLEKGQECLRRLKDKAEEFERERKELKEDFAKIERKVSSHLKKKGHLSVRPDDFLKLRKTIDRTGQMLEFLIRQQSQEKALKDELQKELNKLNNLWHSEYMAIQTELRRINENQPALQITSEFKGDKVSFIQFMKDIFKGSNIFQVTFQSLSRRFVDFAQMYFDFSGVREVVGKKFPVFEQYFTSNLKALLTWQVPDKYTITYKKRELKHHSLGQRASALMLFILSQGENDVIIIDQPEDDLDNQTIYEDVIKLIRRMKNKTQFIFATHNANFPVLGDAEQVHSSRYSDEKIKLGNGSIDRTDIQKEIVNIMEGGKEAFDRRKEIYKIWNP